MLVLGDFNRNAQMGSDRNGIHLSESNKNGMYFDAVTGRVSESSGAYTQQRSMEHIDRREIEGGRASTTTHAQAVNSFNDHSVSQGK